MQINRCIVAEIFCAGSQGGPPCLFGVICVVLTVGRPLLVYPDQRTLSDRPGMSQKCQQATSLTWLEIKEAASRLTALRTDISYIPSTINERDFDVFMRISVNLFCSAELYQPFALSTPSKRMMTKRFGAVPSMAVILSVRLMY